MNTKTTAYWTKDLCIQESLKYKTKIEFFRNSFHAYRSSYKNGWLDEITTHLTSKLDENIHWTKEICLNEAIKYNNRSDFRKNSYKYYNNASKNGWLSEIIKHIERNNIIRVITKSECLENALKYNTKNQFKINSPLLYNTANKNGWLVEICSHMIKPHPMWTKERCSIECKKCNSITELRKHNVNVYNKCRTKGWLFELCKHMNIKVDLYNKHERCQIEASKYNTRSEFIKNAPDLYDYAYKRNILDEVCSHMEKNKSIAEIKINTFKKLKL